MACNAYHGFEVGAHGLGQSAALLLQQAAQVLVAAGSALVVAGGGEKEGKVCYAVRFAVDLAVIPLPLLLPQTHTHHHHQQQQRAVLSWRVGRPSS